MAIGGLQYYKVDTNRYSDIRIRKLKKDCGTAGLAIYDFILCQIYGDNGYFVKDDETLVFTVVDYLNVKSQVVKEVIGYACATGLFDAELHARENILTSRSIQTRWLLLARRTKRSEPPVIKNYWLLTVEPKKFVDQPLDNVVQQSCNGCTTVVQQTPDVGQQSGNVGQQMPDVVQQSYNSRTTESVLEIEKETEKDVSPQTPLIEKDKEKDREPINCAHDPQLFEVEEIPAGAQKPPSKAKNKPNLSIPMEERRQKFYDSLVPFVDTYGKDMIRKFYDYWTEAGENARKMRWEKEDTWCLSRRLQRWQQNNEDYGWNRTSKQTGSAASANNEPSGRYGEIAKLVRTRIV